MTKTRKRFNKKKRSYKKTFKKYAYKKRKGGSKEKCCICMNKIDGKSFIPSACLMKHGKNRAHKICNDCWWNSFAKEGVSHQCPGCEKGLPLSGSPPPEFIDLTEYD